MLHERGRARVVNEHELKLAGSGGYGGVDMHRQHVRNDQVRGRRGEQPRRDTGARTLRSSSNIRVPLAAPASQSTEALSGKYGNGKSGGENALNKKGSVCFRLIN